MMMTGETQYSKSVWYQLVHHKSHIDIEFRPPRREEE